MGSNKTADLITQAFQTVPRDLSDTRIFHIDCGNEFKNQVINKLLEAFEIRRSLSHKGCPYDNAVAEATFKIIKTEFCMGINWSESNFGDIRDGTLTEVESDKLLAPLIFNIRFNATPTLRDGTLNIRLENRELNKFDCQINIEVETSDGSVKTIYESGTISPGQYIEFASIEKDVEGSFLNARVHYFIILQDTVIDEKYVRS